VTSPHDERPAPVAPGTGRTRSFSFLVNPASGGGAAPGAVVPVARRLRDAGASVEVTYSPGPQATRDLVAAAVARGDVVVSVGGDGMLCSVVGEVARRGGTLGLVPAGRGNDFARMLGVPDDPPAQAEVLLAGGARRSDRVSWPVDGSTRVVAGSVYAGVDARAAEIVDRVRWLPGRLQYPYAAVRALATYRPARYRVVVDGSVRECDAATVVVANSRYYGNGMAIAPSAGLGDGLLDVVVIEAASKRALIHALPTVYDGSHVGLPEVTVLTGTRVELSADPEVPVGGDGEPLGVLPSLDSSPAVASVLPGALTVIA
jgi:diacylglycerol kinase (ATP)